MAKQLNFSVRSTITFLLFLATVGCAHHPFAQKWEWEYTRPDHVEERTEQTRLEQKAIMEEIYRKHPEWKNVLPDDVKVVNCINSNNLESVCVVR